MLSLSLLPDEYLSINNGQIIVHLIRVAGGCAHLRIKADRSVPIVRGALLEREGAPRPDCLTPPPRKKPGHRRDRLYLWNDDRERAVRAIKQSIDRLEQTGETAEANILRTQLNRLIPSVWEEEEIPRRLQEQTADSVCPLV